MIKTDVLVIGSGIAGLSYALKLTQALPDIEVLIITKGDETESNTKYAQGGIATVQNLKVDSFEQHIQDTLRAGDGLCDAEVVKVVVEEGPERLNELIEWGVNFDENAKGKYDLGKEGGHSQNRILHHKDITGFEIERALISAVKKQANITLLDQHYAIDFITEHQLEKRQTKRGEQINCYGIYAIDRKKGKVVTIHAKKTLLAAGGSGQIYANTTNPLIATGDGIAMAYRAKADIEGVEFIQFHPTALYQNPQESPAFLITEAVRGFGATLKNKAGESFMLKYDERGALASRDIVARGIDLELKETGEDCVYLDCTELDHTAFERHFPNILAKCKTLGIDIKKQGIPVVPAAHYVCGGVKVDLSAQTSIKNLYACGECTSTGLHGANRLASNSLLEALVYSHRAFLNTLKDIEQLDFNDQVPEWDESNTVSNKELKLVKRSREELQQVMTYYVGIVRSNRRLKQAEKRLRNLYEDIEEVYRESRLSVEISELRNLITTAYMVCKLSMERKENKGGYYNKDLVK